MNHFSLITRICTWQKPACSPTPRPVTVPDFLPQSKPLIYHYYTLVPVLCSQLRYFPNGRRMLCLLLLLAGLTAQAQKTWTGVTISWNSASNWNPAGVPTASDNVVIPSAPANQPILSSTAVAGTVEVRSGASLSITSGGTLTLNGLKSVTSSDTTVTFYNAGTVRNGGQLRIGNSTLLGNYGLQNKGNFTNQAGGLITIDRVAATDQFTFGACLANTSGTFTNEAQITVGGGVAVRNNGLENRATFLNNPGGIIAIDRTRQVSLLNTGNGSFTNKAQIKIGSTAGLPEQSVGLQNVATFLNTEGGVITIDRISSGRGLSNTGGSFTNTARIAIGSIAAVNGDDGLYNTQGNFFNNKGGIITIDRSSGGFGLHNDNGTFTNDGQVDIGAIATVGSVGIFNNFTFTNNLEGVITINRASIHGLYNDAADLNAALFTNKGKITIGAIELAGSTGLLCTGFFHNEGCGALLNIVANAVITNRGGVITNSGTIIENARGNSSVSDNSGIIQNNNGGSFSVGNGPNQPLNLSATGSCNSTDGSITITGLQATTSYTLSYTVGGNATTLSPNPTSDASGQLTIPNLGNGLYAITLGGSCVGLPLSLSTTITSAPDLTLSLYARPSTLYGSAPLTVVVDVVNLCSVATSGLITVRVSKDAVLSLGFESSLTSLGGRSIQNSSWRFSDEPDYYVLTTSQAIAGGGQLSFGLGGVLSGGSTSGMLTVSAGVSGGSGGEGRPANNTAASKVDYFQQ